MSNLLIDYIMVCTMFIMRGIYPIIHPEDTGDLLKMYLIWEVLMVEGLLDKVIVDILSLPPIIPLRKNIDPLRVTIGPNKEVVSQRGITCSLC